MKLLEKFIIERQNAPIIGKYIKDYYVNINWHNSIKLFGHAIVHFIKMIRWLNKLKNRNGSFNLFIDKSIFTHLNGKKIWIIGAKNNKT